MKINNYFQTAIKNLEELAQKVGGTHGDKLLGCVDLVKCGCKYDLGLKTEDTSADTEQLYFKVYQDKDSIEWGFYFLHPSEIQEQSKLNKINCDENDSCKMPVFEPVYISKEAAELHNAYFEGY